jgi:hypothetical protein
MLKNSTLVTTDFKMSPPYARLTVETGLLVELCALAIYGDYRLF